VPVILMVDSPAAEQLLRSRELPVDGYLTKPLDFPGLAAVVQSVADIGFEVRRA
jgi:DNA-binding response OmpR family regulator